ncbi:MAG: phenylalanine--tRNA ligase subunit beta, partial [Bacteroidales bacterium]|nr:phenylalanine--tRNA ligase subunit beta [Bacteroidales bacterium]
VHYADVPRFPEVRRDLALLLDEGVTYSSLYATACRTGKKLLKNVTLFDVYRGEKIPAGKKQYAIGFVLQDLDKTLTDSDVENIMGKLLAAFKREHGATLR